jgi:hypothetical protein
MKKEKPKAGQWFKCIGEKEGNSRGWVKDLVFKSTIVAPHSDNKFVIFGGKSGDGVWFPDQCRKALPEEILGYVFEPTLSFDT